jgi:hypothetical protein
MVLARTVQYEIQSQLNRIHSDFEKDVSAVDIDAAFNRAKHTVLGRYDELVEKNRVLENHLRTLEIPSVPLVCIKTTDEYKIYRLPIDYYNGLRVKVKGCCVDCQCTESQVISTTTYSQQDDLGESLKDPHRKPDWNWRRTVYNYVSEGLLVYHSGILDLKEVYLTYIKWIDDIATPSLTTSGSYVASDGITTHTTDKHLDLDPKNLLWRKMVQVAVYYLKKSLDSNYKVELESILFDENVGVK